MMMIIDHHRDILEQPLLVPRSLTLLRSVPQKPKVRDAYREAFFRWSSCGMVRHSMELIIRIKRIKTYGPMRLSNYWTVLQGASLLLAPAGADSFPAHQEGACLHFC